MNPETMTIGELAAACGFTRDEDGDWHDSGGLVARDYDNCWISWPRGESYDGEQIHTGPTAERDALRRLYGLRFPATGDTPTPAPVVEPEPAQAAEQTMTPTEALGILETYAPCEHSSYDDGLGDGKTWVKCYDCGATVERIRLGEASARARDFDNASWVLDRLIASKKPEPAQAGGNVALVLRAVTRAKSLPDLPASVLAAMDHTFGAMLAEAMVLDEGGGS